MLATKITRVVDDCGRMLDIEFLENRLIGSMGYCWIDCCYKITTTIHT
jgi:hypothetical protein